MSEYPKVNQWVMIVVVAIAFGIFVANSVYMGGIIKALNSGDNTLKLSESAAEAFLWIDALLAGILGVYLIYLIYKVFTESKIAPVTSTDISTDITKSLSKDLMSKMK